MNHLRIDINNIHSQAMKFAQEAFLAQSRGDLEAANFMYGKAFELEKEAAFNFIKDDGSEPTRSVLLRSAAVLAKNSKKYNEANEMLQYGLSGTPPPFVKDELIELQLEISKHLPIMANITPPPIVKKDESNRKLIIWLSFIFLLLMSIAFWWYLAKNDGTEATYTVSKGGLQFKLTPTELSNKAGENKKTIERLEVEIDTLKSILDRTKKDKVVLRDSIVKLIRLREDDIQKGKDLAEDFTNFNSMTKEGQNDFIVDLYRFLERDDIRNSVVPKAINFENQNRIGELDSDRSKLIAENSELQKKLDRALSENKSLRARNTQLSSLYQEYLALAQQRENEIANLNNRIAQLEGTNAVTTSEITSLRNQRSALEVANTELAVKLDATSEELKNTKDEAAKFSTYSLQFEPTGVRKIKKGTFKLGKISKIKLDFVLNAILKENKGSSKTIKLVYSIPIKGQDEARRIEEDITIKEGENITRYFELSTRFPTLEYGEGVYSVQIYDIQNDKTIPIGLEYFTARK